MNIFTRTMIAAAVAGTALAPFAAANAADDGVHVRVGDLSRPEGVAAFDQSLESAARALCWRFPQGIHYKATVQACKDEVRDEAMRQLGPGQRAQLAAYRPSPMAVAGR